MKFTIMNVARLSIIQPFLTEHEEKCLSACVKSLPVREKDEDISLYGSWLSSRQLEPDANQEFLKISYSRPGTHRSFTLANIALAYRIIKLSCRDMLSLLLNVNATRTFLFVVLALLRGLFPAFRGYSQALILDEVQKLVSSGSRPSARIMKLIAREGARMLAESIFDAYANYNENIVHNSLRYIMEYRQMEQRLRLDLPTLTDPTIKDLLYESDLFVRSCTSMGAFGPFSPFEILRVFSTISELFSQLYLLWSISQGSMQFSLLAVILFPTILSMVITNIPFYRTNPDTLFSQEEAKAAERQEQMRAMAHNETFKAEVVFFGLSGWILQTWATMRKQILGLENSNVMPNSKLPWLLDQTNISDLLLVMQNLPYLIYSSTTSLGSLTLYRNSIHSLLFTTRTLIKTIKAAFQSIFFMGAFFALTSVEPKLSPKPEERVKYVGGDFGMKIEARNISFTYPGNKKPTLRDVSFVLEAGETLAIVGYNGSGKSTLANILLRIFDFEGQLLINGTDIRRFDPDDYHSHITALFQGFSKFNTTIRENVGVGDVRNIFSDSAIYRATEHANADKLIRSLPFGLDTQLDCINNDQVTQEQGVPLVFDSYGSRKGLSGGEWQKIAISRTFMRAQTSDMLLLDEPTSHLDAHAQTYILKAVETFKHSKYGQKTKTVIIITHQLSIARKADKIAMLEDGTITEFGTHKQLMLSQNSHYAALYQATA